MGFGVAPLSRHDLPALAPLQLEVSKTNIFKKLLRRDRAQYLYGMKIDDRPDPQQHDVYAWQHRIATPDEEYQELRFGAIVELSKNVCRQHGIELPTINRGLLPMPAYDEHGHGLYFPEKGTNLWMVIHELAHVIQTARYGKDVQGHGPEYLQCYIELLADLRKADRDELFLSAIHAGLTVKGLKPEPLWLMGPDEFNDLDYELEWLFLQTYGEDYEYYNRSERRDTCHSW